MKLRLPDDTQTCQEELILQQFERFYSDLYSAEELVADGVEGYLEPISLTRIPPVNSDILESDVTPAEVLATIHRLQIGKVPGADNFEAEFYKSFGTQLARVLTRLYNALGMTHLLPTDATRCGDCYL
ncbi:hypothetical protein NDU88_006540 [Pleurodeles waltl]|uniref:Uncharacterized protein n=1 Tax=Pleurodeles waltl TaxID=8319 RepID=A0AAV7MK73_PLEWA|nr:hypothetical protein NDU88_006540 [Pleurodeles waltl]